MSGGVKSTMLRPGQKLLVGALVFIGASWVIDHVLVPLLASIWPTLVALAVVGLVGFLAFILTRYNRRRV